MSDETKHMLEHTSKWVGLCLTQQSSISILMNVLYQIAIRTEMMKATVPLLIYMYTFKVISTVL